MKNVIELFGCACVVGGIALLSVPVALIVAGMGIVVACEAHT